MDTTRARRQTAARSSRLSSWISSRSRAASSNRRSLRGVVHLVLQRLDQPARARRAARRRGRTPPSAVRDRVRRGPGGRARATPSSPSAASHHLEDVGDLLADGLRVDAVLGVVLELLLAPAVGLRDRVPHRVGHLVGVHDHLAVDVARGPADHLDQRRLGAEEAFLVGVEDRDQRHLGQVEALPQQVDADEHVEVAEPQRHAGSRPARACRPRCAGSARAGRAR